MAGKRSDYHLEKGRTPTIPAAQRKVSRNASVIDDRRDSALQLARLKLNLTGAEAAGAHHAPSLLTQDNVAQRQKNPDDDEPVQAHKDITVQRERNSTGLPDQLKAGVEHLSGQDLSGVRVHRNSSKPAEVNAHAYAQGQNIHLAPGQEQQLPHETWHTVQQMEGRVKPTIQEGGVSINDDPGLEKEADVMGDRAVQLKLNEYE